METLQYVAKKISVDIFHLSFQIRLYHLTVGICTKFWHHLEQSSEIIDNVLAGTGPSRWESLVVEDKRMNQRNTFIGGDDLRGMSVSFVSSYCLFHSFCERH